MRNDKTPRYKEADNYLDVIAHLDDLKQQDLEEEVLHFKSNKSVRTNMANLLANGRITLGGMN